MATARISRKPMWASLAAAFVAAALAAPADAPGSETARTVKGTLVLGLNTVQKLCRASQAGTAAKPAARISCGATGVYTGQPARAGANYYWTWVLPIGSDGKTKANGPETGRIGLNFGGGAIVYLTTNGAEKPRGTTTARTTGTWTVKNGTGSYAGAPGKGTYTFDTKIVAGSFSVMKITLNGSIS